jgi:hypothetical protein
VCRWGHVLGGKAGSIHRQAKLGQAICPAVEALPPAELMVWNRNRTFSYCPAQLRGALAGPWRLPVDRDLPQPDGISFEPHWRQRFVGTAGPISAASRDVFQPDIEMSWARMSPSFCRPTGTLAARGSISEFLFR